MTEDGKKAWTIMVYMAGDNNLSIDMAYALQEIRDVLKYRKDNVNLLVYYDGYSPNIPTLYCDFSDFKNPVYLRSHKIKNKLYPNNGKGSDKPNENSAYARSVINFVDWCVNKAEYEIDGDKFYGRKADNYALIFGGHTFGFQSIGLLKDESADYYMTIPKLRWTFEQITKPKENLKDGEKEILGQKLAVLGFDSCVMSMLEIGYEFHPFAETLVASEGSIPNAGWTYGNILGKITSSKTEAPTDIAKKFVVEFIKRQDDYKIGGVSVDMAAWDLNEVENVAASFEKLATNLLKCLSDPASRIYKQMKRVLLQTHWNCQSYMFEQNIDLRDFCQLLFEEIESLESELETNPDDFSKKIKENCVEVIKQIDECVILSGFSGGKYQYSNGISLFFPWSFLSYNVSRSSYEKLNFVKNTGAGEKWNSFLKKYLGEVTLRPAKKPAFPNVSNVVFDNLKSLANSKGNLNFMANSKGNLNFSGNSQVYFNDKIPDDRIPDNPADRILDNPADRIWDNPADRIWDNPADRIWDNPADRIFGGTSIFFEHFMGFKNINAPWDISGFTKEIMAKNSGSSNSTDGVKENNGLSASEKV